MENFWGTDVWGTINLVMVLLDTFHSRLIWSCLKQSEGFYRRYFLGLSIRCTVECFTKICLQEHEGFLAYRVTFNRTLRSTSTTTLRHPADAVVFLAVIDV